MRGFIIPTRGSSSVIFRDDRAGNRRDVHKAGERTAFGVGNGIYMKKLRDSPLTAQLQFEVRSWCSGLFKGEYSSSDAFVPKRRDFFSTGISIGKRGDAGRCAGRIAPKKFHRGLRSGSVANGMGIKKEAARLTPDRTASNLKAEGWCPGLFTREYSPRSPFVPKRWKIFSERILIADRGMMWRS
ncbi:MAG: hypothetical protein JWQ98_1073 [Chlorobi bacterium]|nr:hypothetical protein [Chlorobiota bacterium]